jgi:hypothetical protein
LGKGKGDSTISFKLGTHHTSRKDQNKTNRNWKPMATRCLSRNIERNAMDPGPQPRRKTEFMTFEDVGKV